MLARQCEEELVKVVNEGIVGRGKWLYFSAQKALYLKKGSKKEKRDKHDMLFSTCWLSCLSEDSWFLFCEALSQSNGCVISNGKYSFSKRTELTVYCFY